MTLHQSKSGTARLAFSFDRELSICVFALKKLGYSEAQIALELSVGVDHVHEVLLVLRARDGAVKALVSERNYDLSTVKSLKQSAAAKRWH